MLDPIKGITWLERAQTIQAAENFSTQRIKGAITYIRVLTLIYTLKGVLKMQVLRTGCSYRGDWVDGTVGNEFVHVQDFNWKISGIEIAVSAHNGPAVLLFL